VRHGSSGLSRTGLREPRHHLPVIDEARLLVDDPAALHYNEIGMLMTLNR
jgi:hypothetical protein